MEVVKHWKRIPREMDVSLLEIKGPVRWGSEHPDLMQDIPAYGRRLD